MPASRAAGLSLPSDDEVPRETWDRLDAYVTLLRRWNTRIRLVGTNDADAIWRFHVADALQLLPLLPSADRIIDLGSGAGLPGLVLAIATDATVELIEGDQRKAAFLREAIRLTNCRAAVHPCRIEGAHLTPAPVVTARALAPLPKLLALARPLLAEGGICLFPKGRDVQAELTAAAQEWQMDVEQVPSRTHPDGVILRIGNLRRG